MTKYMWCIVIIICLAILNNRFRIIAFNFPCSSGDGSIRIMTYNTNGIGGDYNDEAFVNQFLHAIDSIQPQLLVLQEMSKNYSAFLCDELQIRYPHNSISEFAGSKLKYKDIACFYSKYPIKSFNRLSYKKEELDSIYDEYFVDKSARNYLNPLVFNAVLDVNGCRFLIICCYLKTNDYSKFYKKHFDRWIDGFDDYVNGYKVGSAIRCLEAKMIRDSIAKYDLPTIVCGDMNDFQTSRTVMTIMGEDLKNVWWERGLGYGMTYNKYHLKLRIDHILYSEDFEPVFVDVPHLPFSDHYPIVADLNYLER